MRVTTLASGSRGNATLVQAGGTRVLVDAGVAPGTIAARMKAVFGRVLDLDAIVLTHPHGDHAGKAEPCAERFGAPIYLSQATRRRLPLAGFRTRIFGPRAPFDIGALRVEPFPIPHDAPQVALCFSEGGYRAGIVTDLGHIPRGLADHLRGCQLLLMESNHDPRLLREGPYPDFLKQRIRSPYGHLSNAQAAELLARLGRETRDVVLVHLSETCNAPHLALRHAREALRHDPGLHLASQDEPLDLQVRGRRLPAGRGRATTQLTFSF